MTEVKEVPFLCESFPALVTKTAYSHVDLTHKQDDHEGFFFFLEPKNSTAFPILHKMRIQNYGTAFLSIYGCTDEKTLTSLMPYYALNTVKTRLNDATKEMSLCMFGSSMHDFVSFGDCIRKSWTVLLPDKQLMLERHYVYRDPKFWQKQTTFSFPSSCIKTQEKHPFIGLYIECRPIYDVSVSIVGLGGIEIYGIL